MAVAATSRIVSSPFSDKSRPRSNLRKMLAGVSDKAEDTSTTPTEDPLRILAPGQKKLTNIESQRIIGVVDEAMKRLDYAKIVPYLASNISRFSVSLGSSLVSLLEDYNSIVREYNHLYEALDLDELPPMESSSSEEHFLTTGISAASSATSLRSSLGGRGLPVRLDPLESEVSVARLQKVRFMLRMNVKSILRELTTTPIPSTAISSSDSTRNSAILQESIGNLRSIIHEKLLITHGEEVRQKEHLEHIGKRQLLAEQQISKLEAELSEEQRKKNDLISAKQAEIKTLKATMKRTLNSAQETVRKTKTDAQDKQTINQASHITTASKLNEEITELQKKLQEVTNENQEKEQQLRKRAFKRENELENWIQKYDHEMGEKQDELEQLEEEYAIEKTQLRELEEKLGILTVEYDVVVKEQEEARRKAEESKRKMLQMVRAAQVIQRVWRKYHDIKKSQKGKKKGKGKKGKKGKGKGKGKKGKKK